MKKIVLFFLFISSQQVFAQQSKWGLFLAPSLIENPELRGALQIGSLYDIKDQFQLLSSFTVSINNLKSNGTKNNEFYRLKSEVRYINLRSKNDIKLYVGFQTSFVFRSWNELSSGSFFERSFNADSATSFTSAKIKSPSAALTAQFGANAKMFKKLFFDFSLGLGVKFISTKYTELQNPTKQIRNYATCRIFPGPNPAYWVNGTVTRFQFNPTMSLQYHF